jgi:hypothetical protein
VLPLDKQHDTLEVQTKRASFDPGVCWTDSGAGISQSVASLETRSI